MVKEGIESQALTLSLISKAIMDIQGTLRSDDGEIEEITIDDDENSVGYVSQSELESRNAAKINKKANKFINGDTDDDFDSDVSLE